MLAARVRRVTFSVARPRLGTLPTDVEPEGAGALAGPPASSLTPLADAARVAMPRKQTGVRPA